MTSSTTRLALALMAVLVAGCPNGERRDYAEAPAWQGSTGDTQYEPVSEAGDESLDAYIEETLMAELPPVDDTELGLAELEHEHTRLAEDTAGEVSRALAPAAVIAVLFVPEGPVDLLLSMTPARALGKAARLGKDALKAKRNGRLTRKLTEAFEQALDGEARRFFQLAQKLGRSDAEALWAIHQRTQSAAVVQALIRKRVLNGDVDLAWLARRLESGAFDPVFVRRFTFDADLVEDVTRYKSGPSWRALQAVLEGAPLDPGVRASLASKMTGLLGERAAAEVVREAGFAHRYVGAGARFRKVERGVRHGRGSMDVVAYGAGGELVVAEVKNWSPTTWFSPAERNKILEQLRRHIPSERIATFGELIDDLRR